METNFKDYVYGISLILVTTDADPLLGSIVILKLFFPFHNPEVFISLLLDTAIFPICQSSFTVESGPPRSHRPWFFLGSVRV